MKIIQPRKRKTHLFYKHYLVRCLLHLIYSCYVHIPFKPQTPDADLEYDSRAIGQAEPFIVGVIGKNAQYFLYYEKEQLFESNSFIDSILDLFSILCTLCSTSSCICNDQTDGLQNSSYKHALLIEKPLLKLTSH